jgi:capsular polysaccharide biosynthesis protein
MAANLNTNGADQGPDPREAIQEIIGAIRRNIVRVVFTTLVFLMLGLGLTMIWPNKYQAKTDFRLNETKIVTDAAVLGELNDIPLTRKLQSLKNELRSSKRISDVMDELAWVEWLGTHGRPSKRRALIEKIRENLDVTMSPDVTGAINVTFGFQWTSPEKAAAFVNRNRDAWIKLVRDSYRKGVERRASEAEAVVLEREAEFEDVLAARRKYEQENDVPSLLDTESNHQLKADLLVKISEARAQLESAVTEIEIIRSELLTTEKTSEVPVPPDNPEQGLALLALQQAEAAFNDIKDDYKESHWRYKQTLDDLEKAKAALIAAGGTPEQKYTTVTNDAYFQLAKRLNEKQAEEQKFAALVTTYDSELDDVDDRLTRLPRAMMDMARLDAAVDNAEELLTAARIQVQPLKDQLRALRNQTSIVTGSGGLIATGPFEILEQGIEPENPVLPIGAMIMALSLLMGVGVGLSGPVLAELTRSSFGSVKEVSRSLGVPVLGAVDLILTARDVRSRNVQAVLTIATMVLVLLALASMLYIYRFHLDKFPATVQRALQNMSMALT